MGKISWGFVSTVYLVCVCVCVCKKEEAAEFEPVIFGVIQINVLASAFTLSFRFLPPSADSSQKSSVRGRKFRVERVFKNKTKT